MVIQFRKNRATPRLQTRPHPSPEEPDESVWSQFVDDPRSLPGISVAPPRGPVTIIDIGREWLAASIAVGLENRNHNADVEHIIVIDDVMLGRRMRGQTGANAALAPSSRFYLPDSVKNGLVSEQEAQSILGAADDAFGIVRVIPEWSDPPENDSYRNPFSQIEAILVANTRALLLSCNVVRLITDYGSPHARALAANALLLGLDIRFLTHVGIGDRVGVAKPNGDCTLNSPKVRPPLGLWDPSIEARKFLINTRIARVTDEHRFHRILERFVDVREQCFSHDGSETVRRRERHHAQSAGRKPQGLSQVPHQSGLCSPQVEERVTGLPVLLVVLPPSRTPHYIMDTKRKLNMQRFLAWLSALESTAAYRCVIASTQSTANPDIFPQEWEVAMGLDEQGLLSTMASSDRIIVFDRNALVLAIALSKRSAIICHRGGPTSDLRYDAHTPEDLILWFDIDLSSTKSEVGMAEIADALQSLYENSANLGWWSKAPNSTTTFNFALPDYWQTLDLLGVGA